MQEKLLVTIQATRSMKPNGEFFLSEKDCISAILQVVMEKSLSEEEIYNTISLSSASQMFLMNYAGEEVKRAIADMKDVAHAIHQSMLKKVGGGSV